jgi:hypothetical protein
MNRIYHGTHIYLHENEDGDPCVTTDDYELYDMVEDYLIEDCDLDYECLIRHGWPEKESHTIFLSLVVCDWDEGLWPYQFHF